MEIFKTKWSKWKDLNNGMLSDQYYLLQARRHENGKIQFRVAVSNKCYYGGELKINDLPTITHNP